MRLLGVLLTALLTVTLSGCSGSGRRPGAVVFLVGSRQFNFVQEMTLGFAHGVEDIGGVAHSESGPGVADSTAELKEYADLRRDRPAGLSVFTLSPELFADTLGATAAAGLPVVAVHAPPAPGSGVSLFIGNDNYRLGEMLGEAVAHRLPHSSGGVVVIGSTSPGVSSLEQRVDGVRDAISRLLPSVVVAGPFDTKQEPSANLRAWQTLRNANPGAVAFVGVGGRDVSSLGSLRAYSSEPWVAGAFGFDDQSLELTRKGRMVLVSTESYLQGDVTGRLQALSAKTGRPLPIGWIQTPGLLIDNVNAAAVIGRQLSETRRAEWFDDTADAIVRSPEQYLRPIGEAS
ncbi:sugar ABC transporter substrate-binding protein [Catenuloplanes japonicus]|uniref:sugar ABC transporter substrate-binding protein n=1 Tax=Catenuloplanes japonicus TaxID=33876 RepID=UPI0005270033|nr:sugar ABC transporter substrate-binding protein [Catenuloplanes japonicus]